MESSLHRTLKLRACDGEVERTEITVEGFRIDAVDRGGRLIEVQSAALSALRGKLERLLPNHRIRVVKPICFNRRLIRRAQLDSPDVSSRWSPKRGDWLDVFEEWTGLARIFPHPHLEIELVGLDLQEIRALTKRRTRKRTHEHILDRDILEIHRSVLIRRSADLWTLFSDPPTAGEIFTTRELAERIRRPLSFAQRVAYCLRHAGAVDDLGRSARFRLYARLPDTAPFEDCEGPHADLGEVPSRRKNGLRHRG
ncbi:MAG: hypothetical protein SFX72_15065 [Isosphaeraceae bacterium]|nr:hypothetical protein [Isosphaeraceae bacterium]